MNDDGILDFAKLAVSSEWEPEWECWDSIDNIPTPAIESGTTSQLVAIESQQGKATEDLVRHKIILNNYWKQLVAETDRMPEREGGSNIRRGMLYAGTNYRRMVEPLDIAKYYRPKKRDYINKGFSREELRREELPTREFIRSLVVSKEFSPTWATITEEVWQQK